MHSHLVSIRSELQHVKHLQPSGAGCSTTLGLSQIHLLPTFDFYLSILLDISSDVISPHFCLRPAPRFPSFLRVWLLPCVARKSFLLSVKSQDSFQSRIYHVFISSESERNQNRSLSITGYELLHSSLLSVHSYIFQNDLLISLECMTVSSEVIRDMSKVPPLSPPTHRVVLPLCLICCSSSCIYSPDPSKTKTLLLFWAVWNDLKCSACLCLLPTCDYIPN